MLGKQDAPVGLPLTYEESIGRDRGSGKQEIGRISCALIRVEILWSLVIICPGGFNDHVTSHKGDNNIIQE